MCTLTFVNMQVCRRELHSAPYLYVMSLSTGGLLILAGIPFEVLATFNLYPFPMPEFVCILRHLVCECGCYASALTVTAFSVDRFLAVRSPVHMFLASKRVRIIRICAIIWLISLIVASVFSAQFGVLYIGVAAANCTIRRSSHCTLSISREIGGSFETSSIVFFIIPYIVIAILHVLIIVRLRSNRCVFHAASELTVTFLSNHSTNPSHNGSNPHVSRRIPASRNQNQIITSYISKTERWSYSIGSKAKSATNSNTNPMASTSIGLHVERTNKQNESTVIAQVQSPNTFRRSLSSENCSSPHAAILADRTCVTVNSSFACSPASIISPEASHAATSTSSNGKGNPLERSSKGSNARPCDHPKSARSVIDRRVKAANRVLGAKSPTHRTQTQSIYECSFENLKKLIVRVLVCCALYRVHCSKRVPDIPDLLGAVPPAASVGALRGRGQ